MFELKWTIPSQPPEEVVLRIHSRGGWFGRKQLLLGPRSIFRRGWLPGIDARFGDPGTGPRLALRMLPISGTPDWRPSRGCMPISPNWRNASAATPSRWARRLLCQQLALTTVLVAYMGGYSCAL